MRTAAVIAMLLAVCSASAYAAVRNLGTVGTTYEIEEPDALQEIEERAAAVDPESVRKELKQKFINYRPSDMTSLPPATTDYSYTVDVSHTLEYDIPSVDSEGNVTGVLYPRGYTFNPLDYLPADPPPLVVFNGTRKEELEWVRNHYAGENVMLLTTAGSFRDITESMMTPVYYLTRIIAEKLELKHTVSVVYRKGHQLQVDVHAIDENP
jgi:conjugal transfer pilus assembly protein TraW